MSSIHFFDIVADVVYRSHDFADGWRRLQQQTAGYSAAMIQLPQFDGDEAVATLAGQARRIIEESPTAQPLTFFYFGLFDLWDATTKREEVGFYLAGGTSADTEEQLLRGELDYFPEDRFLRSASLRKVYRLQSAYPEYRDYTGYVLVLATAALLARAAARQLEITIPVYVGFDSGDYLPILPP